MEKNISTNSFQSDPVADKILQSRLRISHTDIIFQGKEFHVHLYVIFFFSKGVPAHKASSKVPLLLLNSKFDLNPDNESRSPMNEMCSNESQEVKGDAMNLTVVKYHNRHI